ncbi:hypothetical protein [Pontibacter rugosus]|uniref:Uncharacterized protein n=1 Tax=Pontibacter rugosus TaxID=1745966 RepID=A0ABW3ST17_9BACT
MSEHLSFFAHEHPQKKGESYTVGFSFPFRGRFFLYSDIKPLNGSPIVIHKALEVAGVPSPRSVTRARF